MKGRLYEFMMGAGLRCMETFSVLLHGMDRVQAATQDEVAVPEATHEHIPHARGVCHAIGNVGGIPSPVTDVLIVCDKCGRVENTRLMGHWSLDQITTRTPPAEVVAKELLAMEASE